MHRNLAYAEAIPIANDTRRLRKFRIPRHIFLVWNRDKLRALYRDRKSMVGAIAEDCNVSTRTAEAYISTPPRQAPSSVALTHLLANNAEYARAHRQLYDLNAEHPDLERIVSEVVAKIVRGQ